MEKTRPICQRLHQPLGPRPIAINFLQDVLYVVSILICVVYVCMCFKSCYYFHTPTFQLAYANCTLRAKHRVIQNMNPDWFMGFSKCLVT